MRTLSKLVSAAVVAIIVLAIWRANNGDLSTVISTVWQILSAGADIVLRIWDEIVAVSASTPAPAAPAPAPAP